MKKLSILLFFSILLYTSCTEDNFTQVVTIDIPEHQPRPALKLLASVGDTELAVLASNSKGILDPESTYQTPVGADVSLTRNGTEVEEFRFDLDRLRYVASIDDGLLGEAGDEFVLTVDMPDFEPVSISQILPPVPIIKEATYEREGTIDPEGYRVDEIVVDIVDPEPEQTNYYGITVYQIGFYLDAFGDTVTYRNRIYIDSNDPFLAYGDEYNFTFNDEVFSGGEYQLRAYTWWSLDEASTVEIELYQITEDVYLFSRSLDQYYNAVDNPFAEPVTVHSNVPDGFGVFGLANRVVYRVE